MSLKDDFLNNIKLSSFTQVIIMIIIACIATLVLWKSDYMRITGNDFEFGYNINAKCGYNIIHHNGKKFILIPANCANIMTEELSRMDDNSRIFDFDQHIISNDNNSTINGGRLHHD